jgi:16S rRNA (guanine(966)-N(2))-methyltransferase RsmD
VHYFQEGNNVRVIAGQARGMRLTAPGGTTTRPTSDRIKEALFSILESANHIEDADVLDLFAGSGALGIEALSRGAKKVVFVEKNRAAIEVLERNLIHTKLKNQAQVFQMDSSQAIERLARHKERFSLVLLDPPYQAGFYLKIIELVSSTVLTQEGLLVAETATRAPLPERIGQCIRIDRRHYGDTALEFYQMEQRHAP